MKAGAACASDICCSRGSRALKIYRAVTLEPATSPNLGGEDKFHWCLLRLCGSEVMPNTAYEFDDERPVPPDPARAAAHQDTCMYFGASDVDAVYEELRAKGLQLKPPKVVPNGMKQLYLSDPDGYGLSFQWSAEPADAATS